MSLQIQTELVSNKLVVEESCWLSIQSLTDPNRLCDHILVFNWHSVYVPHAEWINQELLRPNKFVYFKVTLSAGDTIHLIDPIESHQRY